MICIYTTDDWRVFIDSSKTSVKDVLLHNNDDLPSNPVCEAVDVEETYENI